MDSNDRKTRENEYEAQFFGFTPEPFVNGVYNAVNDYVADCFQELETQIKSEPSMSSNASQEQLRVESEKMIKNFYRSMDGAFDRFEIYVKKNILKIPPHVLLPEDKVQDGHQYTVEDEKEIEKEIDEIERKIKAARYVNSELKQEREELDFALAQLEGLSKQMDEIQDAFKESGGIKKSIISVHEKAEKVHDLIAEGINSGMLQVQNTNDNEDSPETKTKKIKLN